MRRTFGLLSVLLARRLLSYSFPSGPASQTQGFDGVADVVGVPFGRREKITFQSSIFVLQIMDSPCQLSEGTRLDDVVSVLEVTYCALGNSGLA